MSLADEFTGFDSSPLYAHLAPYIAESPDLLSLFDDLPQNKQRPVLLFAAVHYLILKGTDHRLSVAFDAFDTRRGSEYAREDFADFCFANSRRIRQIMQERNVQTNEVNRCTALLPALMHIHHETKLPLSLIDLGTSAGLNLFFDHYLYHYSPAPLIGFPGSTVRLNCELRGHPPQMDINPPPVEMRVGIDTEPVDIRDEDEVLWLRACVWAGDVAREQRLESAIEVARKEWPDIRRGDALTQLDGAVLDAPDNSEVCVFSSWLLSWLTGDQREAIIEKLKALSTSRRIRLLTLEAGTRVPTLIPDPRRDCSILGLTTFDRGEAVGITLGEAHHHGAWLNWHHKPTAQG
jgi:hypothetical protein